MKLKIEFQIEREHAYVILNALRYAYAQSSVPVIASVIGEIEKDIGVGTKITELFIFQLSHYTPHKVTLEADLKYHLAFSPNWLAHPNGLSRVCNETLEQIKIQYGGEYSMILPQNVRTKKLVKDVVEIMVKNYEI